MLAVILVIVFCRQFLSFSGRIVRWFHKAIIRWNPFDELDEQKQKMWETHDLVFKVQIENQTTQNRF